MHPGSRYLNETLSTLQFANSAKQIKNKAVINEALGGDISQLQAEVASLRNKLAQALANQSLLPSALDGDSAAGVIDR